MEVTCSPDPVARGGTLKIHVSGAESGDASVTFRLTDLEGRETEITIDLEGGAGTGHFDVPQDWGASVLVQSQDGSVTHQTVGVE